MLKTDSLHIQPSIRIINRVVMRCTPVAYDEPIESTLLPQHLVE